MQGLFKARWSEAINEEWTRNLLQNNPQLDSSKVARIVLLMNKAVGDWEVSSFEELIPSLSLPDENDRHVLAAAIKANADAIITFNLDDFPESCLSPHGIEALHPDDFVLDLLDLNAHQVLDSARECWKRRKNPPMTWEEYLESLEQRAKLPQSAEKLREVAAF
jgi:predicted nucleic acid-binding protein